MELLVRLKNTKKKAHRIGRDGSGKQIKAAAVCNLGLEGIVSKRLTSIYKSGRRKPGSRSKIRSRRLQRG
jgi:ATP-dependent DNA ligase